jgi:Na+/melibiose symporter-like transporter
MMSDKANQPDISDKRHYTWPWFVLGAVLLAIALAVLWMSKEIERTRRIRDLNAPAPQSGPSAPVGPR